MTCSDETGEILKEESEKRLPVSRSEVHSQIVRRSGRLIAHQLPNHTSFPQELQKIQIYKESLPANNAAVSLTAATQSASLFISLS